MAGLLGVISVAAWGAATTSGDSNPRVKELLAGGYYKEAEAAARRLFAANELNHGSDSLQVAESLDLLVEALWSGGKSSQPESKQMAQRAVDLKEKLLGPAHPDLAKSLLNLGVIMELSGGRPAAKAAMERALSIQEESSGPDHPDLARTLAGLARVQIALEEYGEARRLLERSLAIRKEALGPQHLDVAESLSGLGILHFRTGEYTDAIDLLEQALAIRRKLLRPDHPSIGINLNNLGTLAYELGDYARTRLLYEQALQIREKSLRAGHPQIAETLYNLASLLAEIGDYAEARRLHERTLKITQEALGPEHPRVAFSLNALADLHHVMGEDAAARPLYMRALEIRTKALGPENLMVARSLMALGNLLEDSGEYGEAKGLFDRALAIRQPKLGPDHHHVADCLYHLAIVQEQAGDLDKAQLLSEKALDIRKRALGPDHLDLSSSETQLARLRWIRGAKQAALEGSLRAERISRESFRHATPTLTQRAALGFAASRPSGLDLALSILASTPSPGAGEEATRRVWDEVVLSRAMVLDEMAARHRSVTHDAKSEVGSLARALESSRTRLSQMLIRGPDDGHPDGYRDQIDKARRDVEAAEQALAFKSSAFHRSLENDRSGLDEAAASLPAGAALVAYVRYREFTPPSPRSASSSYLALVMGPGRADLAAVPLGAAGPIDSLISGWRALVSRDPRSEPPGRAESTYRQAAARLRAAVWDPIAPSLGGARQVFVVPDGDLHLVNLATLPAQEGRYLLESGPALHYLSAERDIVPKGPARRGGSGVLALGGPDFEAGPGPRAASDGLDQPAESNAAAGASVLRSPRGACGDPTLLAFDPLPASRAEVDQVESLWRRTEAVAKLTGVKADEATFKRTAPGRRILHLATHGFFLNGQCNGAGKGQAYPQQASRDDSPLLLCGLALAGANRREPATGDSGVQDGLLTAEEIASLDLTAVEWAVLSACETGVGPVVSGEGVLGLRRAFEVAGAGTLIMSLWAVEDDATRVWMRGLYESRLAGLTTVDAVRKASLEMLQSQRRRGRTTHPFLWGAFVAAGDWR